MGKFVVRTLIDLGLVAAGFVAGAYSYRLYIEEHPEEVGINSELHFDQTEDGEE